MSLFIIYDRRALVIVENLGKEKMGTIPESSLNSFKINHFLNKVF